jgi:hypothetical protein
MADIARGIGRACPGGQGSRLMRKYDVTGACLVMYTVVLAIMDFALIIEPMPLYSRDKNEVGRVAVYSPTIAYLTGVLFLIVTWHLRAENLRMGASTSQVCCNLCRHPPTAAANPHLGKVRSAKVRRDRVRRVTRRRWDRRQ